MLRVVKSAFQEKGQKKIRLGNPRRRRPSARCLPETSKHRKPGGHGKPYPSESALRSINPVWLPGPVPNGFWQEKTNRRNYLLWLGYKLGFRRIEDWYWITHTDLKRHNGQGLAGFYWNASAIVGVKECFPEYDWKEWLFRMAPGSSGTTRPIIAGTWRGSVSNSDTGGPKTGTRLPPATSRSTRAARSWCKRPPQFRLRRRDELSVRLRLERVDVHAGTP